jgi:nicotinamidase-related amidase
MGSASTDRLGRDGEGGAVYRLAREDETNFPPERTVLLVIDPVNDFLSEGGAGWEMTKITVRLHDVIGNLKQAIDGARERNIPVLFAPMAYTEEDYREHGLHRRSGINRVMFENKMFLAGSWGADFHPDLRPRADEVVLLPHKGIDVFETDLPDELRQRGTTHLVIAGMTANLCCESTGRRAMEEGYDVTFITNAIGAESIPAYEAAVHVNYPLIANAVMEVDEFLAGVDASSAKQSVQPGDTVRGSDHGEIGTVERVVEANDDVQAHLVVPRGLIFERETFIPLDAVVKRASTTVFINVPKLVFGKMPWDAQPLQADTQDKLGPRAEAVDNLYGSRSPSRWERQAE